MFEQARRPHDLADRFAVMLVALMFLVMLAAIPLAVIDFDRASARDANVASSASSAKPPVAVQLATCDRDAPCRMVVVRTPEQPTEVPSVRPL